MFWDVKEQLWKPTWHGSIYAADVLIGEAQWMHCADVDYELWKLAGQGPKVHCRRSFHSLGALCALAIQSLLRKAVSLVQLTIVVLYLVQRRQDRNIWRSVEVNRGNPALGDSSILYAQCSPSILMERKSRKLQLHGF